MDQMNEQQRYELLKRKTVKVVPYNADRLAEDKVDLESLKNSSIKQAKPKLKELAKRLGILGQYSNDSIKIEFNYGNNNISESINKQNVIKTSNKFVNFAKMLSCFESIIENAQLIEVHRDDEGHNEAPNFLKAYVLVSAFRDGNEILPVKFLIKEYDRMDNILYVSITLQKINEAKHYGQRTLKEHISPGSTSLDISIADLLSRINDEALKKYIPKQFFSEESK